MAHPLHHAESSVRRHGGRIPTRVLGEWHAKEDCGGWIPCLSDWLCPIEPVPWMSIGHLVEDDTVTALSLDAWCQAVATRQTQLGYQDWQKTYGSPSSLLAEGGDGQVAVRATAR